MAASLLSPGQASAQRALPIFGTWTETVAKTAAMITDITPTTMISRIRMPDGVYGKPIIAGPTGYHLMGYVPKLGQAFEIAYFGPDNKFQGGITGYLHDPNHLMLDFGKQGRHYLTRAEPSS